MVALGILWAQAALGQGKTLGHIEGEVYSNTGLVADATVTAWHVDTARTRTAVTGADGRYRFSGLAFGRYAVTAVLGGLQTSTVIAEVNVGEGTVVVLKLENPRTIEEIVVFAESISPVDVTKSETTRVVTAGDVERLPIPRDPNAVVLMAPGAVYGDTAFGAGRRRNQYGSGFGYASLGGASVAENVYYLNGMNVTNLRNGLGASTVPFEFYDQFQLKTGGFGAEFGRATGGVINSVTKRGTNRWQFELGGYYEPDAMRGNSPNVEHPSPHRRYFSVQGLDKKDAFDLYASAGGPLIKDRLLAYAIYDFKTVKEKTYSAYGRRYDDSGGDAFWGVKLDWLLTDDHRIEYTGFSDSMTVERETWVWDAWTEQTVSNLGATDLKRGGVNHIFAYRGYFGPRVAASVLWGLGEYDVSNQSPEDEACPAAYDTRQRNWRAIGCWVNFTASTGKDERDVVRADFEWAVGDNHLLRFGADREVKTALDRVRYSGGEYYRYFSVAPDTRLPNGGVVPDDVAEAVRYRRYERGGRFETVASSLYIEDEWSIPSISSTLRLGLRHDRFDNRNEEGRTFVKITDQLAPRIGFSWDVRGDESSKLFLNYGRYHLPVGNSVNVRLSGSRLSSEEWYAVVGDIEADGSTALLVPIGERILYRDGSVPDVRTLADQDIKPMAQDEYIAGYEWQLFPGYIASIALTYRNLVRGIEDVATDEALGMPRDFNYVLANPGRGLRVFYDLDGDGDAEEVSLSSADLGFPKAKRRYKSLVLDLKREWDDSLYLRATYTLSRSYGNYEGVVRSDTGEDAAGWTSQFDFIGMLEGADGDLPNDRRHLLRVWGAWQFARNWQVNGAFEFSTGRPRNAFGYHPTNWQANQYGPASFYRQGEFAPRGSLGRTDNLYRLDLGLKYTREVFADGKLTVRFDAFNLLDLDSVTEVDEYADEFWGPIASETFGLPTRFQQPRRVRIGVQLSF